MQNRASPISNGLGLEISDKGHRRALADIGLAADDGRDPKVAICSIRQPVIADVSGYSWQPFISFSRRTNLA